MAEPATAGTRPYLVLNGVAPVLTVTLGRPGQVLDHREAPATGRSAEVLAPLVATVLAGAGLDVAGLAGVACVRGPGSFTGIRVVLATALGLSLGAGVPMAGLEALPLLAATAARKATGALVVVTHARAGQVYLQSFLADDGVAPLGPLEALGLDQAAARAAEAVAVGPVWLVGEGADRHREVFAAAASAAVFFGPAGHVPDPGVLVAAAARATYGLVPIAPLYLRPTDAEENLAVIAADRGLSPDVAAARLRQAVDAP
jgi:tRNA threonylcarbamoyladenosine biosynthesis protein TsaB